MSFISLNNNTSSKNPFTKNKGNKLRNNLSKLEGGYDENQDTEGEVTFEIDERLKHNKDDHHHHPHIHDGNIKDIDDRKCPPIKEENDHRNDDDHHHNDEHFGNDIIEHLDNNKPVFAQHYGYGGWKVNLDEGEYDNNQLKKIHPKFNEMSSIKIPTGWEVTVYKADRRQSRKFTKDVNGLGRGFNDKVRSIKVLHRDKPTKCTTLQTCKDLTGGLEETFDEIHTRNFIKFRKDF